ncbi:MAG UNVERIFIED_CONTAM: hypothetical protein LVR18_45845 [Planctomycetaceae bacterium]
MARLPAVPVRIAGGMSASIGGAFELNGYAELVFNPEGFQATIIASLQLGDLGEVSVNGQAVICAEGSVPVLRLQYRCRH